jgi:hypothetical protein
VVTSKRVRPKLNVGFVQERDIKNCNAWVLKALALIICEPNSKHPVGFSIFCHVKNDAMERLTTDTIAVIFNAQRFDFHKYLQS